MNLDEWVMVFRESPSMTVMEIEPAECIPWQLIDGIYSRPDARFFSVVGVPRGSGCQLFLDQPEIGLMGFAYEDRGDRRFALIQAKDEPGNTGITQIAPTVQATKSNIDAAHGGTCVPYQQVFSDPQTPHIVLRDVELSEHGERFWRKHNRNVDLLLNETLEPARERYVWWPLGEVMAALDHDYLINTDARSALSITPWEDLCDPGKQPFNSGFEFTELLNESFNSPNFEDDYQKAIELLNSARSKRTPTPLFVPITEQRMANRDEREWIRFIRVESDSREVVGWVQPIYETAEVEINHLSLARRRGELVVIVRLAEEKGLRTGIEYSVTSRETVDPILEEIMDQGKVMATVRQTEEGSRFYRCGATVNLIDSSIEIEEIALNQAGFSALTLRAFNRLLGSGSNTTNELRTAASLLLKWV